MWDLLSTKTGGPIPPVGFLLGEDNFGWILPDVCSLFQCHYLNDVNLHTARGNLSEHIREMVQWRVDLTSQGSLEDDIGYFHRVGTNFYPYQKCTKGK